MNLTQCCSNLNKSFFFFNDTATTEIYTLSLHDALPIFVSDDPVVGHPPDNRSADARSLPPSDPCRALSPASAGRSEEHTSELQSHSDLVCRLLLEKKQRNQHQDNTRVTKRGSDGAAARE